MAPTRRRRLATLAGSAGTAALVVLLTARAPELAAALAGCAPQAIVGAVVAHAATLACRCEAWRLAVGAIGDRRLGRLAAHAAGGAGSSAGMLQGAATAPVRALALRRIAPSGSPPAKQLVVAEVPIFLVEAALIAVVLALAVLTMPLVPVWAGPAALLAAAAAILALRAWAERFSERSGGAGLRVLADRSRRGGVVALLVAVTALGVLRAWLVLAALGLPHGVAAAGLAFIALGVFGLLPIGPGSTPAAMLAVTGGTDPAAALAAGVAVTATSWVGVGLYAAVAWTLWGARRERRPKPLESSLAVSG